MLSLFAIIVLETSCQQLNSENNLDGRNDSLKLVVNALQVRINELDSAMSMSSSDNCKMPDYSKLISGRFVLSGANCAGFDFIDEYKVLWINEIACFDSDTLKIRWLDHITFMTRSTKVVNAQCPPRIEVYKVVSFKRNKLVLREIWAGWNDFEDDFIEFDKKVN